MRRRGRTDLPVEQEQALRKAVRWEWFTIGYTCVSITLVAFVLGGSQAMRTAWIEDILSLIPPISFLVALLFIRRGPTRRFPYGFHRVMSVGHLVAGVALLFVGGLLAYESIAGLIRSEHPAIGTVRILGATVWLGWLMVAAIGVTAVMPFIYGRAKARLAPILHSKTLLADAAMAKADWSTSAATIVGVLGVGAGWWWLDGAAALFISVDIIWDGMRNTCAAVLDLIDRRAGAESGAEPQSLRGRIAERLDQERWVRASAVRMRDMGLVFHVEAFVIPNGRRVSVDQIEEAREAIMALDWRARDVSLIPVSSLPQAVR